MKKKWKIAFGIVIGAALLVTAVLQTTKPLEAKVYTVVKSDIAKTFKEEGIVRAEKETLVYSVYGGRVIELHVNEGELVKKGDPLVSFDNQEYYYQVQSLQGQMRSIEAQKHLQELTIDLETKKILYDAGIISQKEYEEAQFTISSDYYPALIAAVRAQINQLNYQIAQRNSTSSADGVVANLNVKNGMVVPPGTQLMEIFGGESFIIETFILTEDAARVYSSMPVRLIQNNQSGDVTFSGTIERIAPTAVEKLSTLGLVEQRLKVTIIPEKPADLELKPGYALDVEFTIDQQSEQLTVPKTVLFPYNDGDALWLVKEGKVVIQPVKKGFGNDRDVAIIEGLTEGDFVILNPKLTGLNEGKRVKQLDS